MSTEKVRKLIKETLVRISPDCHNVDVHFDGFQDGVIQYFVNFRISYFPSLELEFEESKLSDADYIEKVIRQGILNYINVKYGRKNDN